MLRKLTIEQRSYALHSPFRIARGAKTSADVLVVALRQADQTGHGECVPYARYDETLQSVRAQLESVRDAMQAGMGRDELAMRLGPGAARNALDAALWDLESRLQDVPVWARLGRSASQQVTTAVTVSLDTPEAMHAQAAKLADCQLLKIKLDADVPSERIAAVRRAAPDSRLIVDANESWDIDLLATLQPLLKRQRVDLVEQPLPADDDAALQSFFGLVPTCADEACHTSADLERLATRYDAVNIKLDKTGGLTEAWRLASSARARGLRIMVGCMVCSSLGIAPALEVAREAEFVDLDGPYWLAHDLPGGVSIRDGQLHVPSQAGFWGSR